MVDRKSMGLPRTCAVAAELTEVVSSQAMIAEHMGEVRPARQRNNAEIAVRQGLSTLAEDIVERCRGCNAAGVFLQGVVECPSRETAVSVFDSVNRLSQGR